MTYPIVRLPPLAAPVDQLWHVLLNLSEQLTVPWTLVGGQMVLLHAAEHGRVPPQISQDGDLIADVRSEQGAITAVVDLLTGTGFELDGISPEGLAHRYVRPALPRSVAIDVLAPEGLGPNTNLTTTKPGRTVEVPGGTQALERSEQVEVHHENRRALVPRTSLLGAVVGKTAACALPGNNNRHLRDLALLCAGPRPRPVQPRRKADGQGQATAGLRPAPGRPVAPGLATRALRRPRAGVSGLPDPHPLTGALDCKGSWPP